MSEFSEAAHEYVDRGWSVFPLLQKAKEPATTHGFKDADCDHEYVDAYWGQRPMCNVGIATGATARPGEWLLVIDLDDHGDDVSGYDTLREWEREHGALPETVSSITGSGGTHIFFRCREPLKCSKNEELRVDIRCVGGYIVAPPSIHPNGQRYEWENPPTEYDVAWADANTMAFVEFVRPKSFGGKFELPERIGKGARNDTLFKYAASLQAKGYDDGEIFDLVALKNAKLCTVPLDDSDVEKIVRSALGYDKGERKPKAQEAQVEAEPARSFTLDMRGRYPASSVHNYALIIENDERIAGRLWYDVGAWTKMLDLPVPWEDGEGSRPVIDADYAAMDRLFGHEYKITGKNALVDAVLAICQQNKRDPFVDAIRSFTWDGTPRICTMMADLFGTQQNEYNAAFGELLMHAIVCRALEPGCKLDYMFIISGPQGCGKSSGTRALAMHHSWFCESLTEFDGDAAVEKLRGAHIVEVPELSAFKRTKEVEQIKTFITQRIDTIRPKYARETEQRPRSCVLMGTTNAGGFLADLTGNRRFLIAEAGFTVPPRYNAAVDSAELAEYVQQLYAEAVAWYDASARHDLVIDDELLPVVESYRSLHVEDDPRVGIIEAYLDKVKARALPEERVTCIADICTNALEMDRQEWQGKRAVTNQIADIMRGMPGWCSIGPHMCGEFGKQRCYTPLELTVRTSFKC